MNGALKRTPLHEEHRALGGKLVPFAGYEMPVQYATGILEEHRAVRAAAGLFDVSHMGEFEIHGDDALTLVQRVSTNDASKLIVGQAQYSTLCNEDGGVLDDCIVYRFADRFVIVVNAANREKDRAWVWRQAKGLDTQLEDSSDTIALIALQGPRSQEILAQITGADLDAIGYYHFADGRVNGVPTWISRTGYTGEDGFELYVRSNDARPLWRRLLDVGASHGLVPAGLGARDSLRLEMGYALYGNDLDEEHNAIESGLGWVVKLDKGDFIGRDALQKAKQNGVQQRLVGFELKERGFPRHGYTVHHEGKPVGVVTSGIVSPSLQRGIGLAWVDASASKSGTPIEIVIRDRPCPAEVVRPPFYKDGSIRR